MAEFEGFRHYRASPEKFSSRTDFSPVIMGRIPLFFVMRRICDFSGVVCFMHLRIWYRKQKPVSDAAAYEQNAICLAAGTGAAEVIQYPFPEEPLIAMQIRRKIRWHTISSQQPLWLVRHPYVGMTLCTCSLRVPPFCSTFVFGLAWQAGNAAYCCCIAILVRAYQEIVGIICSLVVGNSRKNPYLRLFWIWACTFCTNLGRFLRLWKVSHTTARQPVNKTI